ncbi:MULTISPECIES: hypothetical protein [unclassified Streptomyces]|uniref:hypothetical protein n=1 Tax=unclassified Streptomyces TaxID=2593676 RepID=UPI002DDB1672|nr:hypothetical protein [Streptomyces sp. NBC_01775]WSB75713.1 hypothetical protein OHB04_07860 [Streptomyces sp. NBC_01775]WSS44820.1 hypothetical protein OG220_32705 [Streptomyces sp. NBC_01187]
MAGCDFGFVRPTVGGYCVGEGEGTGPKDLGDSAFDNIVDSAAKAAGSTVKALGSAWTDIKSPDLSYDTGPAAFLHGSTLWFTSFTAVLCLLIAAGHIAWQRRSEPGRQALQGLLNLIVVSSAGVAAVNLLTVAGDKFSVWIIDRSMGCKQISPDGQPVQQCVTEFDNRVSAMLSLGDADSSFLVLIMSLLVICASLAQIALMIVRVAMLVILAGTLPLSAAASATPAGRAWFRKSVGWLLAFVLYKPTAAIVYAAAFSMTGGQEQGGEGNEIISMVSGVVLLVLACFTLPALLRLAAPVAQTTLSGMGRGAKSGAGSGGQTVATGAQTVPHLRGLAAGRSVSGATVVGGRTDATGAHSTAGRGGRSAPGSGGPTTATGGEYTAATVNERARQAPPVAVRDRSEEQPESEGPPDEELISSTPTTHRYNDDQQRESRGSD